MIDRHESSDSMIHFCACTKSSRSTLENLKPRDSFNSCKCCGGRLPVDGPGSQSVSMLSTVGLELPRVIDPHLTWKTASNGRRAVRRARTAFAGANRKKAPAQSSKESEDPVDNDTQSTGYMPVSESEKLGVSILGRRFSETLESIPIKKRRFLLDQSSPPPNHSSSHPERRNHSLDNKPASCQATVVNWKNRLPDTKSGHRGRNSADIKSDMEEVNEKSLDAADFSGISILAAAACDDNIAGASIITEASVSKEYSSGGQDIAPISSNLHFLREKKMELSPHVSEGLVGRTDLSASSLLPSKESNDVNSDGSCNLGMSMNSLQKVTNRATESTSRDVKFRWDLNTVMDDVWESNDDVVSNSEPCSTNVGVEGGRNENYGNVETCHDQVGFEDTNNYSKPVDSKVHFVGEGKGICISENMKMEETPVVSGDHSTAGDNDTKLCSSVPHVDKSAKDECQWEDPSQAEVRTASMADVSAQRNPSNDASKSCTLSGDFPSSVGGATVSLGDSSLSSAGLEEERKDEQHRKSFSSEVETENTTYLVSCENSVEPTASAIVSHHGEDRGNIEAPSAENTDEASLAGHKNHSDNCCLTDVQMTEVTHIRSHQGGKQETLCIDPGSVRTALQSLDYHLAEKIPEVLVDGNICGSVVTVGVTADENMHNCVQIVSDISKGRHATSPDGECKTTAAEMKVDMIAAEMKVDTIAAEMKVDMVAAGMKIDSTHVEMNGDKCHLLTAENLNDTTINCPDHVEFGTLLDKSTVMTHDDANAPPENGALTSHKIFRNYKEGYASSPGQFQEHLDSDYSSDASQNDTDKAIGMEKVECLGDDDDSQYEDGEFRQPGVGCWLDDGAEEGDTECVDYDSDRETDIYEAASDLASSVNPQVNNGPFLDTSLGIPYRTHLEKDSEHLGSPSILNCPLMEDALDSGPGKKNAGSVLEKGLRGHAGTEDGSNIKDALKSSNAKVIGNTGFLDGGESARELSCLTSSRMKMSGWDQLPGGSRSSVQNHNGASLDASVGSESIRRASGSSMRDLSSRMERAQSSDGSNRKDKLFIRKNRSNNHNDFNSQVEGEAGTACSIGRSRSSLQLQVKGRGDRWVDSVKHHGNSRHDSSSYYGPASFSNPGSRNAAAAAVAKLESNGFVVAPDGTIVKASAVGSLGRLARGYAKAPSQSSRRSPMGRGSVIERERPYGMPPGCNHSREMSPDTSLPAGRGQAGRYGPRMVNMGQRDRYRAPISDDIIDSPSSMNHPISRTDQSFSPRRRPFHLSRSRSRSLSRSRTRSPPRWTSPRGRNDGGINSSTTRSQQESRSPNFNSEAMMDRPRPGFGEHMINYAPPRNRTSPPRSTRWIDGRKEQPEHFRGHEYRRRSGRSPPSRVFSRGQRYDMMDSSGRAKPAELYRPVNSGKFAEIVGFDKGSKNNGRDDNRRGHGDRYQMLHSMRLFDNDGNMKRHQYDGKDGFRSRDPQPRSSEFQQGESPREFERNIERHIGDSSWRFKEENGQFREDRDAQHNAFKSFGVREVDDQVDASRRRPS